MGKCNAENSELTMKNRTFYHSFRRSQIMKYTYTLSSSEQITLVESLNKIHKANPFGSLLILKLAARTNIQEQMYP
jgi:hypothetical protein